LRILVRKLSRRWPSLPSSMRTYWTAGGGVFIPWEAFFTPIMGLATVGQVYCDCLNCSAGMARRECNGHHPCDDALGCSPTERMKTDGDAAQPADVEKTAQGAVLRCRGWCQNQRRTNPRTRFSGASVVTWVSARARVNRQTHDGALQGLCCRYPPPGQTPYPGVGGL